MLKYLGIVFLISLLLGCADADAGENDNRPSLDEFSAELFNSRIGSKSFKKGLRYEDAISYLRGNLIAVDAPKAPINGEYPSKGTLRYTEIWEGPESNTSVMITRVGLMDRYYQGEQVLMVFDDAVDNKSLVLKDIGMRVRFYNREPKFAGNDSFSSWTTFETSQYSRSLASFTDLTIGQLRVAAIDVVRMLYSSSEGTKTIKTSSSEFEVVGGSVMLLSASGLADDSVNAQEFYLFFEDKGNTQTLASYGLRVKCVRGGNITNWQKEPCP